MSAELKTSIELVTIWILTAFLSLVPEMAGSAMGTALSHLQNCLYCRPPLDPFPPTSEIFIFFLPCLPPTAYCILPLRRLFPKSMGIVRIAQGSVRTGIVSARAAPVSARVALVSVRIAQGSVPNLPQKKPDVAAILQCRIAESKEPAVRGRKRHEAGGRSLPAMTPAT